MTFGEFPNISLTAAKFPDISMFSRQVVTVIALTALVLNHPFIAETKIFRGKNLGQNATPMCLHMAAAPP